MCKQWMSAISFLIYERAQRESWFNKSLTKLIILLAVATHALLFEFLVAQLETCRAVMISLIPFFFHPQIVFSCTYCILENLCYLLLHGICSDLYSRQQWVKWNAKWITVLFKHSLERTRYLHQCRCLLFLEGIVFFFITFCFLYRPLTNVSWALRKQQMLTEYSVARWPRFTFSVMLLMQLRFLLFTSWVWDTRYFI